MALSKLFVCVLTKLPSSLSSFFTSFAPYAFFLSICFLTYLASWLIYTYFQNRPFRFQAGIRRRRPNLALVFWDSFYVVVYFVTDACLLLSCLFQFFSTKPRYWLGTTSPKWPNLCWVGRKTLTHSINHWTQKCICGQTLALQCVQVHLLILAGRRRLYGRHGRCRTTVGWYGTQCILPYHFLTPPAAFCSPKIC